MLKQVPGYRRNSSKGNLRIGKRLADIVTRGGLCLRLRIEDLAAQRGEIAGAPRRRHHCKHAARRAQRPVPSLKIHEEEEPVAPDGAAESSAKNILAEMRARLARGIAEPGIGIQLVIAQE